TSDSRWTGGSESLTFRQGSWEAGPDSYQEEAPMWAMVIGLLVFMLPLQAGEEPTPPTPKEQYEALLKQYDAPRGAYINDRPKAEAATKPFLKLAREAPDDPIAVDALRWVVTHTVFTP